MADTILHIKCTEVCTRLPLHTMDSISSQSRSKLSFSEDDSMSGSRTSSSSKSFWTRKQQNDFIPMDVAVKEQKRVVASKVGMILTLIIVAVSFCVTTYFFLKAEEEKFFEQQVRSFRIKLTFLRLPHAPCCFAHSSSRAMRQK